MSDPAILLPPYAAALSIVVDHWREGLPVLALDYHEKVEGNPGTLHGGAIGGLLELAAHAALQARRQGDGASALKPINVTIEYLRPAAAQRTFAQAEMVRSGRRLGNLLVRAWQGDPGKPVATAFVNVAAY